MRKLYIGNKNYSSWSMRPWVLMKQAGIPFEEVMVRFDSFDAGSDFKQAVSAQNPVGKVPVLVEDDGFAVWDTRQATIRVVRVSYDVEQTQQLILEAGLPRNMADRLKYGI